MSVIKKRKVNKPSERSNYLRSLRKLTPTHILEIELEVNDNQKYKLLSINEHLRVIHNTVLGEVYKKYKQMVRSKKYKRAIKLYRIDKNKGKSLLNEIAKDFNLTFDYVRKSGEALRRFKFKKPDAVTVLSVCEIAWKSIENLMYKGAKKVRFYRKGERIVFQGKQANRSIILKNNHLSFMRMKLPLIVKKNDLFVQETLSLVNEYNKNNEEIDNINIDNYIHKRDLNSTFRVRNSRIVIKKIRGKIRFFAQIAIEGKPVPKRNRDGSFRHKFTSGRVGGDIGTQTLAIVTKDEVFLKNFAIRSESTFKQERKVRLLQRYLDRSRRSMNPSKFDDKGRFIGSGEPWKFSKKYKKALMKYQNISRKASVNRKLSHNEDVNYIRSLGDTFYIEEMNIKGLQKRAKETTKNEKTGKFNKKKRFGKSVLNRSPGYFIAQAKERFKATGGSVKEVDTWSFKASQYCHMEDDFKKKKLSDRWHKFKCGSKVQRDLYSAFLLYCSDETLESANKKLCDKFYPKFKKNHDEFINKIKNDRKVVLNSGI